MYALRYMRVDDIPQVLEIDKVSFPLPWTERTYLFEVHDNAHSHMVVLEATAADSPTSTPVAIGYGGFWLIEGEAHISTIAVAPVYRGKGLGEVVLAGMLGRAILLKAEYAVLEVRVSNTAALNLYRKYEFDVVGRRRRYYRDNNEDALQMHLSQMDGAYRTRFDVTVNKLNTRVTYVNLLLQYPGIHSVEKTV